MIDQDMHCDTLLKYDHTSNVFATLQKLDPLHTHDVVRTTFGHDDYTHGHTNQALSRIFVVQQTIQKSDETHTRQIRTKFLLKISRYCNDALEIAACLD